MCLLPCLLSSAEGEKAYRAAAEPFDRKAFKVSLAATWDTKKLTKAGNDLLANKGPVKVTIEQAAFNSFKVRSFYSATRCHATQQCQQQYILSSQPAVCLCVVLYIILLLLDEGLLCNALSTASPTSILIHPPVDCCIAACRFATG